MTLPGHLADPNFRYSVNEYTGDGSTTQWSFSFEGGYISQAHIGACQINDDGTLSELAFTWVGPNQISISPAIAAGRNFRIYRSTPLDSPLVDFADGAFINEKNLDLNSVQAVFVAAETRDAAVVANKDSAALTAESKAASQAAAASAGQAAVSAGSAANQAGIAATKAGEAANSAAAAEASATRVDLGALDQTIANANAAIATANATNTAAGAAVTAATNQANAAQASANIAVAANSVKVQPDPALATTPPSGVASGDTYWTVDNAYRYLVLYRNGGGTGTLITPTIKHQIGSDIQRSDGPTDISFTDTNGYRWFRLSPTLLQHPVVDNIVTRVVSLEGYAAKQPLLARAGYASWALTDSNDNNWLLATPTALRHVTIDQHSRRITAALRGACDPAIADMRNIAEVIGLHMSGESVSLGHGSAPVYSTTPSPYADMFGNAGLTKASIVPDDINDISSSSDPDLLANRAALTPAFEAVYGPDADDWTSHGETPLSGCWQMFVQLYEESEGPFSASGLRFLLADDGRNGGSITTEDETLTGLTAQRTYASYGQASALYGALGKSYAPAAQMIVTGTNDNASDATNYPGGADTKWYYNRAVTVQAQRQAKARQIVGGNFRLPLLLGQTATHTNPAYPAPRPHVALDQLQLALDKPEFILACIQYAVQNGVNDVHMTGAGSKHMGAYFGYHLFHLLIAGQRLAPLVPVFHAQGSRIIGRFPVRPSHKIKGGLTVADTTVLADWGVKAFDASGVAKPLSNPRVVGRDAIVWDAPETPSNSWKFQAGFIGNNTKGWTNIGETRSDADLIFDPSWLRLPMYRWLPISEVTLT